MSENQSTSPLGLVAMSSVLPITCLVAVILRFWIRKGQKSEVKVDDWIMLPALSLFIGMCICAILGVHRQVWGYPTPTSEQQTDPAAFDKGQIYEGQLLEAFQFIQILTLGCIKLGALLFYRRIFCIHGNYTKFGIAASGFIGVVVLWTIAMTIMCALECGRHISALWTTDVSVYVAECIYAFPFEMGFAISNVLLDLLILLLPIPKIWSLHTDRGRKLALTGVFGLALIGLAASTVRMAQYLIITANGPSLTADIHLEDTETVFWSNLEAGLSLLAVNLPSLWTLVSKVSPMHLLASLRSIFTLRSHGSSYWSRSRTHILHTGTATNADSSWVRMPTHGNEPNGDWHKMSDFGSQEVVPSPSLDGADFAGGNDEMV